MKQRLFAVAFLALYSANLFAQGSLPAVNISDSAKPVSDPKWNQATGSIMPLAIFSPPPDCQKFNDPVPLADSCYLAPFLSGDCLGDFCGTNAGFDADQPGATTTFIPEFETNGWLRIAPCEDSIAIDFHVFDCQIGNEMGFFLLSGTCDTMTLISFISATGGNVAHLTASGLTPGEVYYLVVDGFYDAECKFQVQVLAGIGTAGPGPLLSCDCTDGFVEGPDALCPGDFGTYTLTPGSCDVTYGPPVGGNGIYCPPPDICGSDSLVLRWSIPPGLNFTGDSINVFTITVQADPNLIGIDTMLTGDVTVFWELVHIPPDTSSSGNTPDNNYCGCHGNSDDIVCSPIIIPKTMTVHHDVEYVFGVLDCTQPCYFYNGQTYCNPGQYTAEQTNCTTTILILASDYAFPFAEAGPDAVLNCVVTQVTLFGDNSSNGPSFTYAWSGPGISPFNQNTLSPTVSVAGNYTLVVTNTANGCTETDNVVVTSDTAPPTVSIAPVSNICNGASATLTAEANTPFAQYVWSNGMPGQQITVAPPVTTVYTVTVTNLNNGCTNSTSTTVQVLPPIPPTQLSPITICQGECVALGGEIICPPLSGIYNAVAQSYQGCDSAVFQSIMVEPYLVTDHGTVGALTCVVTSISFMGNTYDQPGNYTELDTSGCGEHIFTIVAYDIPPLVDAGQPQQICIGESATLMANTNSDTPQLIFMWDNGATVQQITVTPNVTTTYTVTVTDTVNGCTAADSVQVEVMQQQVVQLGTVGTLTCAQPCFNFNGQEYCQPGTYSFTENCEIKEFQIAQDSSLPTVQLGIVGTLTCAQPCFNFNGQEYCQPGTYSFTENCEIKEFQIGDLPPVWLELGEDKTIAAGESVELQAQTNAQPAFVSWYNPSGAMSDTLLNITVQPTENTLYSIEIQDINGCLLADSVWVLVQKAAGVWYAPNVIRPGSDGLNAWFTLFAGDGVMSEIQLLEIYDRWGNLVFARKNYPPNVPEMGWNGAVQEKTFNPAVFVWYAELLLPDGTVEKAKGDVTVVR